MPCFSRLTAALELRYCIGILAMVLTLTGCLEDGVRVPAAPVTVPEIKEETWVPPTPLVLEAQALGKMPIVGENPLTVEGVALGKTLFHDPILSLDSTLSCASCHHPAHAFADQGKKMSLGIKNRTGTLNSPSIFNLAWAGFMFWDGRSFSLEDQALHPVPNVKEMALPWSLAVRRLQANPSYRKAFRRAFGDVEMDSMLTARALAQFERTLISVGSRYDAWKAGKIHLTAEEELGFEIFNSEKGDCAACHAEPFFTKFAFANIGLDSVVEGTGQGRHTGNASEMGKWKTPSLRNLTFTAPYMHDGRFATLEEVLDFYETGGIYTATLDANIHNPDHPSAKFPGRRGLGLSPDERKALLAFLAALNDTDFTLRHQK